MSDGGRSDAGVDAGQAVDAGHDAGAIVDAGVDAGFDAGFDAGQGADAGQLQGADTCDLAPDVSAGGLFTGQSTLGAADDYGPSGSGCPVGGAASGRDVAYVLRPSVTTSYTVRVVPAASPTFDPMLYAVTTCGGSGCVAGTVLNGSGEPEQISFTVNGGETVYVVVDGELGSRGDFDLEIVAH